MRLATRRLHALDNVAPLTFPVCGVCDKAIIAQPYEVDGKAYHQGGCLIELGHRVTEEIWKAKEAARVAAEEKAKMYDLPLEKAYLPRITYQPFIQITDGTTSIPAVGPYYGGGGTIVAGTIVGGGGGGGGVSADGNTIFLPASMLTTSGNLLTVGTVSGTASGSAHSHSTSTHTHTSYPASTWDTVAINDGEAIEMTVAVSI